MQLQGQITAIKFDSFTNNKGEKIDFKTVYVMDIDGMNLYKIKGSAFPKGVDLFEGQSIHIRLTIDGEYLIKNIAFIENQTDTKKK